MELQEKNKLKPIKIISPGLSEREQFHIVPPEAEVSSSTVGFVLQLLAGFEEFTGYSDHSSWNYLYKYLPVHTPLTYTDVLIQSASDSLYLVLPSSDTHEPQWRAKQK